VLSSLSYAILALLATRPQTGYDISRQMRPPLGFIWQAKHGQIYPELARLVAAGLVDVKRMDTGPGPPRRVHSITTGGRAELTKWIVQPPHLRAANDELVIKAYALRRAPAEAAMSLLREQFESHSHRLAALEHLHAAVEARISRQSRFDSPEFGEYAALRRAIGVEREQAAWCRWLLEELEATAGADGRRDSRQPAVRRSAAAGRRPAARRTARTDPRSSNA
jgi:DNA-binding PadR family transcriptional regulator